MFKSFKFLSWVHSNLERIFPWIRQGYWYYIFFLKESTSFINIEPFKFKDNALTAFKNCKALKEKII